jgi:hypothetical protein
VSFLDADAEKALEFGMPGSTDVAPMRLTLPPHLPRAGGLMATTSFSLLTVELHVPKPRTGPLSGSLTSVSKLAELRKPQRYEIATAFARKCARFAHHGEDARCTNPNSIS